MFFLMQFKTLKIILIFSFGLFHKQFSLFVDDLKINVFFRSLRELFDKRRR